ncbi:MAG: hypothetical protein MUC72_00865 [Acidobacteria bacterium]|nr:hypothetical protein [Acidobacteriota bacterium]
MKKTLWIAVFSVLALNWAFGATVNVIQPAAGNSWVIGGTHVIRWSHEGFADPAAVRVVIRLRQGETTICTIAQDVPLNQLSYSWNSAACTGLQAGTYSVRVRVLPLEEQIWGDSSVFTMAAMPVFQKIPEKEVLPGRLKLPDLLVDKCWIVPEHPNLNDTVRLHARLRNAGQAPTAKAHDADIVVRGPQGFAQVTRTFRVEPLAIDESHEIFLDYSCSHWGVVSATVTLDSRSEIHEANESNNEEVYPHSVSPLPDLVACMGTPICVDILTKKKIWVVAVNRGPAESPPCRLRWYVEQNGVVYRDVPRLEPGQEQVFHREVRFDTKGKKDMAVIVDCEHNVQELSEGNNNMEGAAYASMINEFRVCIPAKACADGK